jgi:hypothetical protein
MDMVISLFTAALFATVVVTQTPDLDGLRWNSRVILLFALDTNNSQLAQQKEMLDRQAAGIKDRDLKVFEITGRSPSGEQLRDRFHVKADSFAVVLIGKDGSTKLKHSEPTDPNEIFKLIDSMPMRKDEMRQRQ